MQGIGLISIFSASIYVSMMALYYARILASQHEFEKLVRDHMQTAAELRAAVSQAERASQAKAEHGSHAVADQVDRTVNGR